MSLYVFFAILISALVTFSLRALPFLLFSGGRKMPDWLRPPRRGTALRHHGGADRLLSARVKIQSLWRRSSFGRCRTRHRAYL